MSHELFEIAALLFWNMYYNWILLYIVRFLIVKIPGIP